MPSGCCDSSGRLSSRRGAPHRPGTQGAAALLLFVLLLGAFGASPASASDMVDNSIVGIQIVPESEPVAGSAVLIGRIHLFNYALTVLNPCVVSSETRPAVFVVSPGKKP